jgi:toxin ParE1/3/4
VVRRIHPEDLAGLVEAAAFYEERAPGLGRDFFEEVERVFRLVGENRGAGASLEPPYHRFVCRRFPFAVIYRERMGGALVLAVMHQRRQPGYWKDRG